MKRKQLIALGAALVLFVVVLMLAREYGENSGALAQQPPLPPIPGTTRTPTPVPPAPTPTFVPLRETPTPVVVPANYPTPVGLPTQLPRIRIHGSGDLNTVAQDTKLAALVALVTVKQIDPPVFRNPTNTMPAVLAYNSAFTPAVLHVLHVYKGPPLTEVPAAYLGACFSSTECAPESVPYRWTDLIGYQVVMFFNPPRPDPYDHNYHPFRVYVVNPGRDEVMDISRGTAAGRGPRSKLSELVAQVEAAAR